MQLGSGTLSGIVDHGRPRLSFVCTVIEFGDLVLSLKEKEVTLLGRRVDVPLHNLWGRRQERRWEIKNSSRNEDTKCRWKGCIGAATFSPRQHQLNLAKFPGVSLHETDNGRPKPALPQDVANLEAQAANNAEPRSSSYRI